MGPRHTPPSDHRHAVTSRRAASPYGNIQKTQVSCRSLNVWSSQQAPHHPPLYFPRAQRELLCRPPLPDPFPLEACLQGRNSWRKCWYSIHKFRQGDYAIFVPSVTIWFRKEHNATSPMVPIVSCSAGGWIWFQTQCHEEGRALFWNPGGSPGWQLEKVREALDWKRERELHKIDSNTIPENRYVLIRQLIVDILKVFSFSVLEIHIIICRSRWKKQTSELYIDVFTLSHRKTRDLGGNSILYWAKANGEHTSRLISALKVASWNTKIENTKLQKTILFSKKFWKNLFFKESTIKIKIKTDFIVCREVKNI